MAAIAALHVNYIGVSPPVAIEYRFLRAYYRCLLCRDDSIVYVAIASGKVIGFASLVRKQTRVLFHLSLDDPALIFRLFLALPFSRVLRQRMGFRVYNELWAARKVKRVALAMGPCELRAVTVQGNYRGQKIGDRLLRACLDHARREKWDPILAWVAEGNVSSNRLFQQVGFRRVGSKAESQGIVYLYLWQSGFVEAREAAGPQFS